MNTIINIVTIVQARIGSSRLPAKVMLPLAGRPLLVRLIERIKRARLSGTVVAATTYLPEDDIIVNVCRKYGIDVFRGHPLDLLDRHYRAALKYDADIVLKIPSDVPLIDPTVIDSVVKYFIENNGKYDYVSNLHPATYPDGHDVEVMRLSALKNAWENSDKIYEREHTTPYIWENPDVFKIGNVEWQAGLDYSMSHRWTIDYPEDYDFIKTVYDELYGIKPDFGINDILELLEKKPFIAEINSKYAGVNWYRNHLNELKTINPLQTRTL